MSQEEFHSLMSPKVREEARRLDEKWKSVTIPYGIKMENMMEEGLRRLSLRGYPLGGFPPPNDVLYDVFSQVLREAIAAKGKE